MENTELLVRVIGALALITGLLLIALYGVKRWSRTFHGKDSDQVEVMSIKMLLPKKYLVLVRVGEKILTLGATDNQITLLDSTTRNESAGEKQG